MSYGILSTNDILNDLCKKIRKLELEPGSMISENEMAEVYNVSRSSIRTVFSKLEQMLLIKRFPQIGTYISPFDIEYVNNALYVRSLIELEAIHKVIKLENKDEVIKKLEENISIQKRYKEDKDYESKFQQIDVDFHKIILESVNLLGLREIIKDSNIHIARWRNFDIIYRNKIPIILDEHNQILESIKNSDIKSAYDYVRKHLLIDDFYLERARKEYPDYFKKRL